MYQRGLKLWSSNTDFLEKAAELYDNCLYDYIELYVVPDTLHTLTQWKKLSIPFIIHTAHCAHGFNLADARRTAANKYIYNQTRQFADALNAKYIIFHGGTDGDISQTIMQMSSFQEPRALIENKPYVALPNNRGNKYCRGYDVTEIKQVMERTQCGFCFDVGHAICAANALGEDRRQYCRKFLQLKPTMYHLTDLKDITSPYDSHTRLGAGNLDFRCVFNLIPDKSYVTFETEKDLNRKLDDFAEDMVWLNNF